MTVLSVNLNKIALLRNSRESGIPSVLEFASTALANGADGITVHPRPDLRHIRPEDVRELSDMLEVEFNIEGNPFAGSSDIYPGFIELVKEVKPAQCTLVPDSDDQLTSDHGWDLQKDGKRLKPLLDELKAEGIRISLFMDADSPDIELAAEIGADRIELYTGPYAWAYATENEDKYYDDLISASQRAKAVGLGLNAGHDLNLDNLGKICKLIDLAEVSIGHAITLDALEMGFAASVRAYKDILERESL